MISVSGSTQENLSVDANGVYSVTISDANNCSATDDLTVDFSLMPFHMTFPIITVNSFADPTNNG